MKIHYTQLPPRFGPRRTCSFHPLLGLLWHSNVDFWTATKNWILQQQKLGHSGVGDVT